MSGEKNYTIIYAELVNRCWEDPGFLAKFKEDPIAVLEEFGLPTVPGANYHIVSPDDMKPSTEEDVYLPLQEKPGLQTMGDDMLDDVAGGGFLYKHSNIVVNANAVAQNDAIGYTEAAVATISVEVAYG